MNDFTKDELIWISSTIGYYESDGGLNLDERPVSESIHIKLQCLIDNYDKDQKVKDALNYIALKAREWKIELRGGE